MRRYETVFIVNPDLSEEQNQPLFEKLNGLVDAGQGLSVKMDEWGHKRLAYEVKKHTRGYYVLMDYCGTGALVKEIERNLRLDDRVLKYMTVLKDQDIDLDALKAEIEAAKEQEKASQPAEQAAGEGGESKAPESGEPEEAKAAEVTGEAKAAEVTEEPQAPVTETESTETTEETGTNEEPKTSTT